MILRVPLRRSVHAPADQPIGAVRRPMWIGKHLFDLGVGLLCLVVLSPLLAAVAVLVRLRSDRCFYADPPPSVGEKVGRPRRHGQKFTCAEEATWWAPTSEHGEEHAQYGSVRVRAWAGVHTKTHNHPAKGSYRPKAVVRGTLVLVEVERLPRQTRIPKRLELMSDLVEIAGDGRSEG